MMPDGEASIDLGPSATSANALGPRSVECPICGSSRTRLLRADVVDLEYFVVPLRPFVVQKCDDCGSEFLDPRPVESELPPSIPTTTTPTTRTTEGWPGCWSSCGPGHELVTTDG